MAPSSSGLGRVDISTRSGEAKKMICTYILECKDGTFYIGSTNNLKRRLNDHKIGKNSYTKSRLPTKLVYKKEFNNLTETRKFEYFIKRQRNKKFYLKLIKGAF